MYRMIGADGREYGPVTADQLREWIAEGRVDAQTKALVEGLGEGKADPGHSGAVTLAQLDTWLRTRVKDQTLGTQTPVTARPTTALDFPIVILP